MSVNLDAPVSYLTSDGIEVKTKYTIRHIHQAINIAYRALAEHKTGIYFQYMNIDKKSVRVGKKIL